jgi:hypothetical protein
MVASRQPLESEELLLNRSSRVLLCHPSLAHFHPSVSPLVALLWRTRALWLPPRYLHRSSRLLLRRPVLRTTLLPLLARRASFHSAELLPWDWFGSVGVRIHHRLLLTPLECP